MDNNTNTSSFSNDYIQLNDGSYVSKADLAKNSVKVDTNQGLIGTAVDQLGNDLGTMGNGILGLTGDKQNLDRAKANMLANQYIDSKKDYGDFSPSGLLNLGIRNVPLMLGTLGTGALARKGAQGVVEGLLQKELGELGSKVAFNAGMGAVGGLQNLGQNNAQNYADTGQTLSSGQGLASFGSGAILNTLEGNAVLGKFGNLKDVNGFGLKSVGPRSANALRSGVGAGAINVGQDVINRETLGKDLTSKEALSSYGHSLASGIALGAPFGAVYTTPRVANTPETPNAETTSVAENTQVDSPMLQLGYEPNVQPQEQGLLQLGYDPSAGKPVMYGTDGGIVGQDINAVSDQRLNDYLSSGNQSRVDANNVQTKEQGLLQLGYDPEVSKPIMYASDTGAVGKDINQVSDQRLNDLYSPQELTQEQVNNVQPQEPSLLQLGYDSNVGRPEQPVMYGTDSGIVGQDINSVSNQRLKDYLESGNKPEDTPIVESFNEVTPERKQPQALQLGYDSNVGKPVMYASDTGVVGNDMGKVSEQRIKDLYSPQELKKENTSPKSREELIKRLSEKEALRNPENENLVDTTPEINTVSETPMAKKPVGSIGMSKILEKKYGTTDSNIIALKKKQEQLNRSKNPSFEEDIRTLTGDESLFKNGELTFQNKELSKPVETAINSVANDIRNGVASTPVDTSPMVMNDTAKAVATKKIRTPKVKKDFVDLNEKVLSNPSAEKIALLNNVKNEIEKSNVADATKLMNTISKVSDNLTEETAKNINDSFVNKGIDEDYVKEIQALAKEKLNKVEQPVLDKTKEETYQNIKQSETEKLQNFDNKFDSAKSRLDNGIETRSIKEGNSTIEKIIDGETTQYLRDGQLHNEYGPALIEGKKKEYYLYDEKLSAKEWREQVAEINANRIDPELVKKNESENRVKFSSNVFTENLRNLVNDNVLSSAVEYKKANVKLSNIEQERVNSYNRQLDSMRSKVNVDIEVISPEHYPLGVGDNPADIPSGWFDSDTNKIYIVANKDIKDTFNTVLRHELYHKGIWNYLKSVGKADFEKVLDRLYENSLVNKMTEEIKNDEYYKKSHYEAIEEALSRIVENENNRIQNPSFFNKVFDTVRNFLNKLFGNNEFVSNNEVKNFLDKTQKLVLSTEEVNAKQENIERVIRFSKQIRSDASQEIPIINTLRSARRENQLERNTGNLAERWFNRFGNMFNSESDPNLTPYANPLGTKLFSKFFNTGTHKVIESFAKQDHLLSYHGEVGQSILNIINSVTTLKGDITARLESESTNFVKLGRKINENDKTKIFEIIGKNAGETPNRENPKLQGNRVGVDELTQQLKAQGFSGEKLAQAVEYAQEFRKVADYGIHISKMNDNIGIWEMVKKMANSYDGTLSDKVDTLITQSFRNEFKDFGKSLDADEVSLRNFNENFNKILDNSGIVKKMEDIIASETASINQKRDTELSQDVSNKTKPEYEVFRDKINAKYDSEIESIPEKQHLENINYAKEKMNEHESNANDLESRGFVHKDFAGKYFLVVKTMANGQLVKHVISSDDINEISQIKKQIDDQFGDLVHTETGKRQQFENSDILSSLLSLDAYGGELSQEQQNLLSVLQGYGEKLERKYEGVGYNTNLDQVISTFAYNKINQIANKHKMGDISTIINSIDGPNKVSMKAHITDILQTMAKNRSIPSDTVGAKIRGVTSIWSLGANVSNTLAQVFQTGMVAPNFFRKYTNETSWRKSLVEGHKFLDKKTTGNKELDGVLSRLENNDLLSASQAKSMFEAKENPLGKSTFDRIKEKAYYLNEITERRLRYATVMEAFKIYKAEETKRSQGKPFDESVLNQNVDNFVLNSIRVVNGDFSKQMRGQMYQNDLVATLMMFQDWKAVTFNAFRQMDRSSQVRFALQHSFLMSGLLGVPFADDLVEITDAIFRFFGVEPPVRKAIEKGANFLDESLINGLGDYAKHGIPMMGEKIGLGQLIPNLGGAIELVTGDKNKGLKGILGPSGNLITNMAQGVNQIGQGVGQLGMTGGENGLGDVARGFVNLSPGIVKSVVRGSELLATGSVENAQGNQKLYEVSRLLSPLVMANFRSPGMADSFDEYKVLNSYKTIQNNKLKQWKEDLVDAFKDKDFKQVGEITSMIRTINPKFNVDQALKEDKSNLTMKEKFLKSIPKYNQAEYKDLL